MRRPPIRLLAGSIAAVCAIAAAGAGSAPAAAAEPVSIFFLLQAERATFTPAGDAEYRVRFGGTRPVVYGFTDRPYRMANHATMQRFISTWKTSDFVERPPNAAVVVTAADRSQTTFVLTLSRPVWNKATRVLTFDATLLRDITSKEVSVYRDGSKGALPTQFSDAKIFIDSFNPCGAPPTQASGPRPPPAGPCPAPRR